MDLTAAASLFDKGARPMAGQPYDARRPGPEPAPAEPRGYRAEPGELQQIIHALAQLFEEP